MCGKQDNPHCRPRCHGFCEGAPGKDIHLLKIFIFWSLASEDIHLLQKISIFWSLAWQQWHIAVWFRSKTAFDLLTNHSEEELRTNTFARQMYWELNCPGFGVLASIISKEGRKGPGVLEHTVSNHNPLARNQWKHSRGNRHRQGLPDPKCFLTALSPGGLSALLMGKLPCKVSSHSLYPFQPKVSWKAWHRTVSK